MKRLLTAAMALSVLATAGVASAQPGRRDDHNPSQMQRRDDHNGPGNGNGFERRADKRFKAPAAYHGPKGYKGQRFHRGDKLSAAYRGPAYRVDYRRYNLAPPPRGYEYVRVNNDVVLTAIATGVITLVLMDLFN
jgi:Ni/Co efflux regulator RcnB